MPKYPFTPELLDALPEKIAELYRELESTLLYEICSRLNISDELNEVTVQDIRALRSHGIELDEIKKAISETARISEEELDRLFADVISRNEKYFEDVITIADVTAPPQYADKSDIDTIMRQTHGEISNITRSMGFYVTRGAGRVLLDAGEAYQWALDSAVMQIQSGGISYRDAVSNAVKRLADSGLKTVSYNSGHVDSVDVAVRRAVMTGVNQLNARYNEQSAEYLRTDLVEVSAHIGARNTGTGASNHESWQGKVYRWAKYAELYPNASEGRYPDFVNVTGYGTGEGLLGWNCRHNFRSFIEGVTERTYTEEQLEDMKAKTFEFEGRQYDTYTAAQKQRQIERTVRKLKRERDSYKAAGLEDDAGNVNIRLRRLGREYKEFSSAAGLPEQRDRMKVYAPRADEHKIFNISDVDINAEKINNDYTEFIKTVPEKNRAVLEYAFNATPFVRTYDEGVVLAYSPRTESIVYNPSHENFNELFNNYTITHELGHRIDHMFGLTADNKALSKAIADAKEIIERNRMLFSDYSFDNDKYVGVISDVFSAIDKNRDPESYYSHYHDFDYWQKAGYAEAEVFANIFTLECSNAQRDLEFLKEYFPEIMEEYEKFKLEV